MKKRDLIIMSIALAAAMLLAVVQFLPAEEAISWGLAFPTPGQTPEGPATAKELSRYDAYYVGSPEEKVLYLTFDAGYENGHTGKILDVLQEEKVPAAFFLVGHYIEKNPDLVRRMVTEGHIVGNHTMHHADMSALRSEAAFQKELQDLEQLYTQVTGAEMPKFYRPPQGLYSKENLEYAQKLGYKTIFWSLAYGDWKVDAQPTEQQAFAKLMPRLHNGAIILLHSTSATNARILREFIARCREAGYRFAPLTEL